MKRYHFLDLAMTERETLPRDGMEWADMTADNEEYDVYDDYAQHSDFFAQAPDFVDLQRVEGTPYDFTYTNPDTGEKHYVEVKAEPTIKYEVRTVTVETSNGKNCYDKFTNSTNQSTELVKAFDTKEQAIRFYETIPTGCKYCGNHLYEHYCKLIEENSYDEDGEWVNGGDWWDSDFPDYKFGVDDEED